MGNLEHIGNKKIVMQQTWIGLNKVEVVYQDFSKQTYDKVTFEQMHKAKKHD